MANPQPASREPPAPPAADPGPVEGENLFMRKLIREHSHRVLAVATMFASSVAGRADIAQEVWVIALLAYRQADIPADPGPWLTGVARNVGRQFARKQARQEGYIKRYLATAQTVVDGEPDLDEKRRRDALREAIDQLPDVPRAIMRCRLRKMSVKETAKAVGCSEGTVKSCFHRTSRALIRQLREPSDKVGG